MLQGRSLERPRMALVYYRPGKVHVIDFMKHFSLHARPDSG